MAIGTDGEGEPLIIDGNEVEPVLQFNFLGSLITKRVAAAMRLDTVW